MQILINFLYSICFLYDCNVYLFFLVWLCLVIFCKYVLCFYAKDKKIDNNKIIISSLTVVTSKKLLFYFPQNEIQEIAVWTTVILNFVVTRVGVAQSLLSSHNIDTTKYVYQLVALTWYGISKSDVSILVFRTMELHLLLFIRSVTARKMKFSVRNFFSKCEQICSFLRICSHLLKKFLMENSFFCIVITRQKFQA